MEAKKYVRVGAGLAACVAAALAAGSPVAQAQASVEALAVAPAVVAAQGAASFEMRVASFNVRCLCSETNPQNVWTTGGRGGRVAQQIIDSKSQIVGLQETYNQQVSDLFGSAGRSGMLGPGWAQVSTGAPEALNAIGWKTGSFTRLDSGFRYLSTGPAAKDGSSRAYERTVNWVKLRSTATGQVVFVFNTHLEHRGSATFAADGRTYGQVRATQVAEVLEAVRAVNQGNEAMVLTGDFNANETDQPFKAVLGSGMFKDSLASADTTSEANIASFNGWRPPTPGHRVDFVFASKAANVLRYRVFDTYVNGLHASDHFPVFADVRLTAASPSIPNAGGFRVYSVPTSSNLYAVTGSGAATRATVLTFAQWQGLGFPSPRPAPVAFVKYAWSPDIYMVNFWTGTEQTWTWTKLDGAAWKRAGYPRPYIAGWISGTSLMKYGSSDQILATLGGVTKVLTGPEWAAMGYKGFANRVSAGFVKGQGSTIYLVGDLAKVSSTKAPVTFALWALWGFPAPKYVPGV